MKAHCYGKNRTFYSSFWAFILVFCFQTCFGITFPSAMEKLTLGGFNALSDKEGFIVVYPDGIEGHWNDGRGLEFYRTMRENIDDVGSISVLIEYLAQTLNIDRSRVYATGISNGGLMSQRLAHELSHEIAAIATVAVQMSESISLMRAGQADFGIDNAGNKRSPCAMGRWRNSFCADANK